MLGGEHDNRTRSSDSSRRGRYRVAVLGRDVAPVYLRWIERRGFKREVIDISPATKPGSRARP